MLTYLDIIVWYESHLPTAPTTIHFVDFATEIYLWWKRTYGCTKKQIIIAFAESQAAHVSFVATHAKNE